MAPTPRKRYPGINFFTEADKDIFCGRSDDAKKLLSRMMLNNTLVLHGESGSGKSSLLRAGLLPLLKEYNANSSAQGKPVYLPVIIKFDPILRSDSATLVLQPLIAQTMKAIYCARQLEDSQLPYIEKKTDSLWYTVKQFEKDRSGLLLIFDQFEDIQSYPYKEVKAFRGKLAEPFISPMPEAIYQEYDVYTHNLSKETMTSEAKKEYNENVRFLEHPADVKMLFVVREDRLGAMSLLADDFPDILKNDLTLLPLTGKGAERAIVEPAGKEGEFMSLPFQFETPAVEFLLEKLVDGETGLYDPIQLQIVCSTIEKRFGKKGGKIRVGDIPHIKDIISVFYQTVWAGIRTEFKLGEEAFDQKRMVILKELVEGGRRNLVLENVLFSQLGKEDEKMLSALMREGLLRRVFLGKEIYYQLTHDRLIRPVIDDLQVLKAKENVQEELREQKLRARTFQIWMVAGILGVLCLVAIYLYFHARNAEYTAEEDRQLLISTSLKRSGNPTLAYVIGREFLAKHQGSRPLKQYLGSFDRAGYVYLRGIYPTLSEVRAVDKSLGDTLAVTEGKFRSAWEMNTGMLVSRKKIGDRVPDKQLFTPRGRFDIFESFGGISIADEHGRMLMNVPRQAYVGMEEIALSRDNRYLLLGKRVFDLGTGRQIAEMPVNVSARNHLNAATFLEGDTVAAGYSNGSIVIYSIDPKLLHGIGKADTLQSPADDPTANEGINLLVYDATHRYLLAADAEYNIGIFDPARLYKNRFDSLNYDRRLGSLKGHTGKVTCLSLSPDQKYLLSGSADNTAILWDLVSQKPLATLKDENASTLTQVGFFGTDKDLFTVSSNGLVYVWKRGSSSVLYDSGQLYRSSPFDYYVWGLAGKEDIDAGGGQDTKRLFTRTLNYLMNMPIYNEYPDDDSYKNILRTSDAEIRGMFARLTHRSDYRTAIADYNDALLDKYYYDYLANAAGWQGVDSPNSPVDSAGLDAKRQIAGWKLYFLDTTETTAGYSLVNAFMGRSGSYQRRPGGGAATHQFLRVYEDSVLVPLLARHGGDVFLTETKVELERSWLRYYTFAQDWNDALKIANRLANIPSPTFRRDIYVIATYLLSGNYDEAAKRYRDLARTTSANMLAEGDDVLVRWLHEFNEKGIGKDAIARFGAEFPAIGRLQVRYFKKS